jgi:hypothetical protein
MGRLILSNYGQRVLGSLPRAGGTAPWSPQSRELWVPYRPNVHAGLVERGLAEVLEDGTSLQTVRRRYRHNPLRHVGCLVIEYTTRCPLDCAHCRNGHLPRVTETRVDKLREAVDVMAGMGVRRFDFMGGEVTFHGDGWLEVVERVRRVRGAEARVLTSGWFLGRPGFTAAGQRYQDDGVFLRELRRRGVTHVIFALDGPEGRHDAWRGVPGLYRRVLAGFEKARQAGLRPAVSLVVGHGGAAGAWDLASLQDVARLLYADEPGQTSAERLLADPHNYVSNLVDIGNAVTLRQSMMPIDMVPDQALCCKQLHRPCPSIGLKANGALSLCPLVDAGDGYGNIHEDDLVTLLNRMQDRFTYRLHAERRVAAYRDLLDQRLFGGAVDSVCTLRALLTMIARRVDERGVEPSDVDRVAEINREVARLSGFAGGDVRRRES